MKDKKDLEYLKDSFKVACVFLGCVIGAGFASGREIYSYFVVYKADGYKAILTFAVFLFATLWALCNLIVRHKIRNQGEMLGICFGGHAGKIMFVIIIVFCFCEFSVMASGFDALLQEQLQMDKGIGFVFFVILMYFILIFGKSAMVRLNAVLSPFMLWCIVLICVYVLLVQDVGVFAQVVSLIKTRSSYFSAILYWGYNALTGIGLLCALGDFIPDKKRGRAVTLSSALLFIFSVLLVFTALGAYYGEVSVLELPVLYLAGLGGDFIKGIYAAAMACAMITTAAAAAFAVTACAPEGKLPFVSLLICGGAFCLYSYDFSYLIDNLYAFFGLAGIALCAGVIAREGRDRAVTWFRRRDPFWEKRESGHYKNIVP